VILARVSEMTGPAFGTFALPGSFFTELTGDQMSRLLLVIALIAGISASAKSRDYDLGWSKYRNERFGLSLTYPAKIFRLERAAETGDGQLFISKDGQARLLVGALENSDHHSPATYQQFIARRSYPGFDIDYAPVGRRWSVLSGERDGTIFYEKVIFSCGGGVINSFAMMYPTAQRELYDAIVEHIEDTFRAGSGGCT
jgi:hypothetical protein